MGDPIYNNFDIESTTRACLQVDPVESCKIKVSDIVSDQSFVIERKNNVFRLFQPTTDVIKAYPKYSAPMKEIADYLLVKGEIFNVLGDLKNPAKDLEKINLGGSDADKSKLIFIWTNILCNFISLGQLDPKNPKMRMLMESTIQSATYSFADPFLGTMVQKVLTGLKDNQKLDPQSRKRAEWLLPIYDARETFWSSMKPVMDKSESVSLTLKELSSRFLVFMFATYIHPEKDPKDVLSSKDYLFSNDIREAAKTFHQVLSKIDPNHKASDNFYAFIKSVMPALRTVAVPEEYKNAFLNRVNFIETEYKEAATTEMINILSNEPADAAFAEYLQIKYGDTPARSQALSFILKNMTAVKTAAGNTSHSFAMEKIRQDLKTWGDGKPTDQKKEAREAVSYLLKTLFEQKNGKIEVFWDKKIQETDNFYKNSLAEPNKSALEKLILWTRQPAESSQPLLSLREVPHVELWNRSLKTELGFAALGAGVAVAARLSMGDSRSRYYVVGSAVTVGAAAAGAAAGNWLCRNKLNVSSKRVWLCETVGGVVGGGIGGLSYRLTAGFPGMSGTNTEYPVDPYGP